MAGNGVASALADLGEIAFAVWIASIIVRKVFSAMRVMRGARAWAEQDVASPGRVRGVDDYRPPLSSSAPRPFDMPPGPQRDYETKKLVRAHYRNGHLR